MNVSLSNKVTWLLVAVLGLSLLAVGTYAVREQETLARDLMRQWVSQCASRYLERLGQGLADSDLDRIVQTGQALVKGMPVSYCEILNQSGEVAFQEGYRQENPVASFVWPVPYHDVQGMVQTVGRLNLVLSPGPMTVAVSRIGQTISIAGLGILFMGLLLGGLAIRSMLGQPIRQLVDGADRVIQQGDLAYRIGIDREDELGHLAKAINTLADEVRGSILKDQALSLCVDHACQTQETLSQELGQDQRSDAVDFIQEHIEQSGDRFWVETDQGMNPIFHFTVPELHIEAYEEETKGACK
ncbi:MAG: HAMP domain-containing protein [Phycisphaeraceae bacterium]|nr:HAMP domain-containing protein [Phycisphaeraceae bacterium]